MIKHFSITSDILVIVLLTAYLFSGCGYTKLAKMEPRQIRHNPLPDLTIESVNTTLRLVQPMDAPEKEIDVRSIVHVTNIGQASFQGTIFIGWIDKPYYNRPTIYDYLGPFIQCTLTSGDTIELTKSWSYPLDQPITLVKLVILTDDRSISQNDAKTYNCGAFPVQEERYDNNESEIVIFPDSIKN